MKKILCLHIVLSLVLIASGFSSKMAIAQSGDNLMVSESQIGINRSEWTAERWVDGKQVGKLILYVPVGAVKDLKYVDAQGNRIHITVMSYPANPGEQKPSFAGSETWFRGGVFGVGAICAQQVSPGEKWIFSLGSQVIHADTACNPNQMLTYSFRAITNDGNVHMGSVRINEGEAFFQAFADNGRVTPNLIILPPGACMAEIDPKFVSKTWLKVPIPSKLGEFYGFARDSISEWIVTIDGIDYSAKV